MSIAIMQYCNGTDSKTTDTANLKPIVLVLINYVIDNENLEKKSKVWHLNSLDATP